MSGLLFMAVHAYDNGMARTPPMGWNSWCTDSLCNLAGKDPCSEHMVKTTADAMVAQGMLQLGYNYVTLDDCWSARTRDSAGQLQPDPRAFPSGMKALADYVHAKGLLFGLYTCVGTKTCKGDRPGSYGHYAADAATLASWGVDYVKMDHCGLSGINATDRELYGEMSAALNATGRPITFGLCQWGEARVWEWGAQVSQLYRIQADHLPFWSFPSRGTSQGVGYGQGVRDIIEWMATLKPSKWTRRFGWLDPDFLMTLYWPTMSFTSSRTEYSFWVKASSGSHHCTPAGLCTLYSLLRGSPRFTDRSPRSSTSAGNVVLPSHDLNRRAPPDFRGHARHSPRMQYQPHL